MRISTLDSRDLLAADAIEADESVLEVYCWRLEQLLAAGYTPAVAGALADDTQIDLHTACDMRAHGCPEATAYRILA